MLPIIAVTGNPASDQNGAMAPGDGIEANAQITNAVVAAGGLPVILPYPASPQQAAELAKAAAAAFAGFILPGGPDVTPALYDAEPLPGLGATQQPKDEFDIALIHAVLAAHKPIFAFCRGIQILNVALGGSLYQDLPSQVPTALQHRQETPPSRPTHHVTIAAGSRLATFFGASAYVNSRHHQAIERVAPGLTVTATASDGIVEGVSDAENLVLGVQWHPENMWQTDATQFALFQDLIQRAKN